MKTRHYTHKKNIVKHFFIKISKNINFYIFFKVLKFMKINFSTRFSKKFLRFLVENLFLFIFLFIFLFFIQLPQYLPKFSSLLQLFLLLLPTFLLVQSLFYSAPFWLVMIIANAYLHRQVAPKVH